MNKSRRTNRWWCAVLGLVGIGLGQTAQADLAGFANFQLNANDNLAAAGFPMVTDDSTLTFMDGVSSASASAWAMEPQSYADGFEVRFTYAGGFSSYNQKGIADGFTFALQNSDSGLEARGNDGGSLGFEGQGSFTVNHAAAIACQIAGGSHIGYAYNYGYAADRQDAAAAGVRLDFSNQNQGQNNEPVNFTITYKPLSDPKALQVVAVQGVNTFTHTYVLPDTLPNIIGAGSTLPAGMAYVGFTAGAGGDNSSQVISGFSYTQLTPPAVPVVAEPFDANANGFRVRIAASAGTTVDTSTLALTLDGQTVTPTAVVDKGDGVLLVSYQNPNLMLASGSTHEGTIEFAGSGFSGPVKVTNSFTIPAYSLIPAAFQVSGNVNQAVSGFVGRVHALPVPRYPKPGDLTGVERQLADGFLDPATGQPYENQISPEDFTSDQINWSLYAGEGQEKGHFTSANAAPQNIADTQIPGLDDPANQSYSTQVAAEILTILDLPAGSYQLGVSSANAYKLSMGSEPRDIFNVQVLATSETAIQEGGATITVTNAGFYPVRLAWAGTTADSQLEFYLTDFATGSRILINDQANSSALKAYRDAAALAQPYVRWVTPSAGQEARPDAPIIVKLEDGATVQVANASLQLNGEGTATVKKTGHETTLTLEHGPLAANSTPLVTLVYQTSDGNRHTNTWQYTASSYQVLPSRLASGLDSGTASEPGFKLKAQVLSANVLMSTYGLNDGALQNNDLDIWRTVAQGLWDPSLNVADLSQFTDNGCYLLPEVINFALGGQEGFFGNESLFPFLPSLEQSTDDCLLQAVTYVRFPAAGFYEMGVNSDDGFELRLSENFGGSSLLTVTAPAAVARSFGAVPARGYADSSVAPAVSARVIKAEPLDLAGGDTNQLLNASAFKGNIVLLERGAAGNLVVELAQQLGAVGVIEICAEGQWPTPQNPAVTIPAVRLWTVDGQALEAQCTTGVDSPVFATVGGADQSMVVSSYNGGRGSQEPSVFGLWVAQPGVYPMRLLYQNGGGGASVEWWSRDANGVRHLINDRADAQALLAYRSRTAPVAPVQLQVRLDKTSVVLSWTGNGELQVSSTVNGTYSKAANQANPQTISQLSGQAFFRVKQN